MKTLFIYSEEGCPWCSSIKEELKKSGIKYLVRDIDRYDKEWERISKEINTEYIPTLCIVDHKQKTKTYLVPDIDFDDIGEAVEKAKILMS